MRNGPSHYGGPTGLRERCASITPKRLPMRNRTPRTASVADRGTPCRASSAARVWMIATTRTRAQRRLRADYRRCGASSRSVGEASDRMDQRWSHAIEARLFRSTVGQPSVSFSLLPIRRVDDRRQAGSGDAIVSGYVQLVSQEAHSALITARAARSSLLHTRISSHGVRRAYCAWHIKSPAERLSDLRWYARGSKPVRLSK